MNSDEHFMSLARDAARQSTDPSTHVGCVIVTPNGRIISSGYNSYPSFMESEFVNDNDTQLRHLLSVHAEMRALINAKESINGCTIFVTHASCDNCLKHLIEAGIAKIVYESLYTNGRSWLTQSRLDAIVRLLKGNKITEVNMGGKNFLDDVSDNPPDFNN